MPDMLRITYKSGRIGYEKMRSQGHYDQVRRDPAVERVDIYEVDLDARDAFAAVKLKGDKKPHA